MIKKLVLFINTLSYLKPIQIYWRFVLKYRKLVPVSLQTPRALNVVKCNLVPIIKKNTSLSGDKFTFLNQSGSASLPISWNDSVRDKLWLYNLHYFDFLNQEEIKSLDVTKIFSDWIENNEVGKGNGWEPYPLSLRIVNWIKYLSNSGLSDEQRRVIINSLYIQTRYLRKHLEFHLLGNHLFKNCVSLIFAGLYFDTKEASEWLQTGKKILNEQIKEQILTDGGHFERSPMYHAIFVEDLMDVINIAIQSNLFSGVEIERLMLDARRMCLFLVDILHQDLDLPLLNDCALGISAKPLQLFDYASRLGVLNNSDNIYSLLDQHENDVSVNYKEDFGVFVIDDGFSRLIMDAGVIGPDYLPGHAHCDTLSYELSISGHRCIVNSGTYQYAGEMRNIFRATQSHNTVQVDSEEQHEIWSTFRVARRGRIYGCKLDQGGKSIRISGSHSGYQRLPGNPAHTRTITLMGRQYIVKDGLDGAGVHLAASYIHLHPDVLINHINETQIICCLNNVKFSIDVLSGNRIEIEDGWYSDEFGKKQKNKVLTLREEGVCPMSIVYSITYSLQ